MVNACLVFFFETGKENKRKERGEKKEKERKEYVCKPWTLFSHTFSPILLFLLLPQSWRALKRAPGHSLSFPAEQTNISPQWQTVHTTARAVSWMWESPASLMPGWGVMNYSTFLSQMGLTGYLPFTDLPLMLTRKTERVTHLNLPVFTQNAEGYYSALQLLIPDYLCLN